MIIVTRINDRDVLVNCDQIEMIEEAPDTTITTMSGKKVIVRETVDEVMEKIIAYKQKLIKT
ncbi:MAG: flagellar FlbD family protein [Defluviitaleaceae bacterium]|nr:flagellar FlbD family protein [Defluviitaleaceae bacterium]